MIARLLILLSILALGLALVSDISHRFLQRESDGDDVPAWTAPYYMTSGRTRSGSPDLELTSSRLLHLADLLRKRNDYL
ncbi:unnamed protein product [Caenorhabditis auriculariae]|uniref:Uncharacterized protein n=1 Tax=Caenorhabditis auriculariae TaxID=2777116 RepID=A0A8S1HXQ0_9PELO|nr:unnamed protein product [Caenorhabditis auriculariae]